MERSSRIEDAILYGLIIASALYFAIHFPLFIASPVSATTTKTDPHAELLREIIMLESSGRHDGVWGDEGTSYGILQFKESTFDYYAKKYGLNGWDWSDQDHQILLADRMLKDGKCKEWSVCQKAKERVIMRRYIDVR